MSNLHAQVLDFINVSGEALEASQKLAAAEVARQEKVASLVPGCVDSLISSNLIAESRRAVAIEKLASHEGALDVVANLIDHIQKMAAAKVKNDAVEGSGTPEAQPQTKTASAEGPYVGRRLGDDDPLPTSWQRFNERMGLG